MIKINQRFEYFIFCDNLNKEIKERIIKFKNINFVYYNEKKSYSVNKALEIKKYCKKNKINFFLVDNYKLAIKIGLHGVYLSSLNKSKKFLNFFNNKFTVIGSAHNQIEYFHKKQQGCSSVMVSPLFYNKKYSENKILGPIKINLITKNWRTKIGALGGISPTNYNKTKLLNNINILGFKSFINFI
jgi:thiamine-phosphate pyrophosphorylase